MQNVLTLVTDSTQQILDETIINKVFVKLEKKSALVSSLAWLAEGEACDIFFDDLSPADASSIMQDIFTDVKLDFIVQENKNRKKKMLISDMDSTIIQQECIDEIADKMGIKDKVAAITERAMNGELDFADSLQERVALLAGLDESELLSVYENSIELMPGAKELVKTMHGNGAYCMLVSGGFTFFTDKIAELIGFDENRANILEIKDGKLTGKATPPILDANSKLLSLEEMIEKLQITKGDVAAVGDGANDLPMLKNAGLGVAYHAKDAVKAEVAYKIDHTDLRTVLYAQGYKKEEFHA